MSHSHRLVPPLPTPVIDAASLVRSAPRLSPHLLDQLLLAICPRACAIERTSQLRHLRRLAADGAGVDTALALLALELPFWHLRRLVEDGGVWHCRLARTTSPVDIVGDIADGWHEVPELAIMAALVDAIAVACSEAEAPAERQAQSFAVFV